MNVYAKSYDSPVLGDHFGYGFSTNVDLDIFLFKTNVQNHKSASQRSHGVDEYFKL